MFLFLLKFIKWKTSGRISETQKIDGILLTHLSGSCNAMPDIHNVVVENVEISANKLFLIGLFSKSSENLSTTNINTLLLGMYYEIGNQKLLCIVEPPTTCFSSVSHHHVRNLTRNTNCSCTSFGLRCFREDSCLHNGNSHKIPTCEVCDTRRCSQA